PAREVLPNETLGTPLLVLNDRLRRSARHRRQGDRRVELEECLLIELHHLLDENQRILSLEPQHRRHVRGLMESLRADRVFVAFGLQLMERVQVRTGDSEGTGLNVEPGIEQQLLATLGRDSRSLEKRVALLT